MPISRNSGKFGLYAYVIMRLLLTENMLMQRLHYTHQNPVHARLVKRPEEYRWSSIRGWIGGILDDEPLLMNIDRIKWRENRRHSLLNILVCQTVSRRLTAMCCGRAANYTRVTLLISSANRGSLRTALRFGSFSKSGLFSFPKATERCNHSNAWLGSPSSA
jgi:hypothetical protein